MAIIINPITTVLMTRAEFLTGEFNRFPFKYIIEENGDINNLEVFTAGRSILRKDASVPGIGAKRKAEEVPESVQPLAYGIKVPVEMFYQVHKFFLAVMDLGPSSYEAQVFIVWNEKSKEYRIVVPDQIVSGAAVSYDLKDQLDDSTDVIIMDIHSHNNMNAFFSGTDNKDDRSNAWISGVFGKITTTLMDVFRFNDGKGGSIEMSKEDIFEFNDIEVDIPSDWVNRVTINKSRISHHRPHAPGEYSYHKVLGIPEEDEYHGVGTLEDFLGASTSNDSMNDTVEDLIEIIEELSERSVHIVIISAIEYELKGIDKSQDMSVREATAFLTMKEYIDEREGSSVVREALNDILNEYL